MESIITRVVIIAFKEISKSYQNFEMKHIYEIVNLAFRETGKKINLTNNIICENLYGNIVLSKNDNKYYNSCVKTEIKLDKDNIIENIEFNNYIINFEVIENKKKEKFTKNNLIKLFNYDKIEKEILIRYRKDGDKIIPLGMSGSKKVKDIFINSKVPREERDNTPILCFDDKISWIVGYKTSQLFKIDSDTKMILKITVNRKG